VIHDVVEVLLRIRREREQLGRDLAIDASVLVETVRVESDDAEHAVDELDGEVSALHVIVVPAEGLSRDERRTASRILYNPGRCVGICAVVIVMIDNGDDVGILSPGAECTVVVDQGKTTHLSGYVRGRSAQLVNG
jgi:hypothetical protein